MFHYSYFCNNNWINNITIAQFYHFREVIVYFFFCYRVVPNKAGVSPPNHEQGKSKYMTSYMKIFLISFSLIREDISYLGISRDMRYRMHRCHR